MDQVDQDYLKEILKTTSSGFSELTDVKIHDDGTTYEEVMVLVFCSVIDQYVVILLTAYAPYSVLLL